MTAFLIVVAVVGILMAAAGGSPKGCIVCVLGVVIFLAAGATLIVRALI